MDFPVSPTIGQRYTFGGKTWEYNGEGWAFVAGGTTATPGGSSTQIQYNDGGILGGDPNFTWDKNNDILTLVAGEVRQTGNIRFKPTGASTTSLIIEPTHSQNTSSFTSRAYDYVQGGSGSSTGDGHSISMSATGGATSNFIHVEKIGTGTYAIYKSIAIGWGPATGLVSSGTAIYMQANTSTGALQQVVIGGTAIDGSGAKLLVSGSLNVTSGILSNGTNISTLYAASGHTHTLNDLTDATITSPTPNQVLQYNGSQWVNAPPPGTTDLSWSAATRTVASSTGNDAVLTLFSPTADGLTPMSGGGTANFLRADGTWAAPAETGQVSLQFQDEGSNLGASGTVDTLDFTGSNLTASRIGNKVTVSFTGAIGSGITYTYAPTAPVSPNPGDEWVDSSAGILYKYISDGDTTQWVDFSGSGAPIFTSTLPGIVPASGGGSTSFLRADGTWVAPAGTGTVTSVGLSLPAIFNVSNSPVTTTGTLTGSLASQTQNLVFASPNGSSGSPTFRALVAADIPTLNQNTTGTAAGLSATLVATSGGTGQSTYATGDILYASAPNTLSKLAAGTNTHVLTLAAGVPTWSAPPGGTPGGSNTQLQYNNAGAFGGISNVTANGTNITFATGARILGDFGNSTVASRASFQSSVTNDNTWLQLLPNGTATSSGLIAVDNATPTNAGFVTFFANGTVAGIQSGRFGSGTARDMVFYVNSSVTQAVRIFEATQNVNIGSTATDPSVRLRVEGATTITSGKLTTAATVAGYASLNLPHGTAPSAPADGDVWTTTSGIYAHINGGTVGPLGTGGGGGTPGGSNKQLQYNNSGAFGGITGVEYDSATTTLSATGLATTSPFTTVTYGATTTINCRTGNLFRIAMTGNITTLTINNAADGQTINVVFVQDGTGGRTVVWPASFVWVGQTTPILNVGPNKIDVLTAQYSSADSKWLCSLAIQDAPAPTGVTTSDVIALIMGLA